MKRDWLIAAAVLVALGGLIGILSVFSKEDNKKKKNYQPTVSYVQVDTCGVEASPIRFRGKGFYKNSQKVELVTEVSGKISQSGFQLLAGNRVGKGKLLLKIDAREAEIQYQKSLLQFQRTLQSFVPALQIDFPESVSPWREYYQKVLEGSWENLPEWSSAKLQSFAVSQQVPDAFHAVEQARLHLEKHFLRAPSAGEISEVKVVPGAFARSNSVVADFYPETHREIQISLPAHLYSFFPAGSKAWILKDGEELPANLLRISQLLPEGKSQIDAYLKPLQTKNLLPGELLEVVLEGEKQSGVCAVPVTGIRNQKIWTVVEGKLKSEPWQTLWVDGGKAYGKTLTPGTVFVTGRLKNPVEGMPVKVPGSPKPSKNEGPKKTDLPPSAGSK